MAIDQVHNETIKLTANWLNATSVAIVGGGTIVPILSYYFGNQEAVWPDPALLIICATVGLSLHLAGQFLIGRLESE